MHAVTEQQLRNMLESAIRYKQALVVHAVTVEQLREICRAYDVEVVDPFPALPKHDQQVTLVRLLRQTQRERAMIVPYWSEIPKVVLTRVHQVRLVA